jgi:hypothetical protein
MRTTSVRSPDRRSPDGAKRNPGAALQHGAALRPDNVFLTCTALRICAGAPGFRFAPSGLRTQASTGVHRA